MADAAVLSRADRRGRERGKEPGTDARPLRVLVLSIKPEGVSPGQRFRLEQWAPHLQARHGIEMDFLPFESPQLTRLLYQPGHAAAKAWWVARDFLRRAAAVLKARRYDAVIVYREAALIGPAIYERLLAWTGVPLLFDFDDAIWQDNQLLSPVNGVFSKLHFWGKTATTCRLATGVTVGNDYLADYARRRNSNVFVIPTTVDLDKYRVLPEPEPDDPFIVAWTGTHSTLVHFEQARNALERLARQRRIKVKIICSIPPAKPIDGAENEFVPWSDADEAETVAACHAGIMPLFDDEYTRGKCGAKAIQFMGTGRPVVISPVGMNKDLIRHGENGFLAANDDEFVDYLTRLADSRELRERIGKEGRRTVEERFSATVAAEQLARALRESIERVKGGDR